MKKIFSLICISLLCLTTAVAQDDDYGTKIKEGMDAPSLVVKMHDGSFVTSADMEGKVVLITFWATWCPPCRAELMRTPKDIVERYADNEDFIWLPISRGEKKKTVESFLKKHDYTFVSGLDEDESIFNQFAEKAIPRNFIIGKDGKVALKTIGYAPEEFDEMLNFIDGLLK